MPELPDLIYIEKRLVPILPGRTIRGLEIFEPVVLRNQLGGDLNALLSGVSIKALNRHGPFLQFELEDDLYMVVHFMLAGRFAIRENEESGSGGTDEANKSERTGRKKQPASLCFTLVLEGLSLDYLDDKKMGKVYFCKKEHLSTIPGFAKIGPDLLGPGFTLEYFLSAMGKSRRQARVFLKDHALINSVGNAYADEILFEAKIHPKRPCNSLAESERLRLYEATLSIMKRGIDAVEEADRGIDVKVRDHMRVRNRKDQPCPECGTKIRRANVLGYDAFYCPSCQPLEKDLFGTLLK